MAQAKKRRTRGYVIGGILFALLLVVAVVKGDLLISDYLADNKIMPVKAVEIDGAFSQLTKRQIADIAGKVCAGQNIATFDLDVLKNALLQEPWVAHVSVAKKMPDTLVIAVVEHVPAAVWNDQGLYDARTKSVFYPDLSTLNLALVKLGALRDNLAPEVYDTAVKIERTLGNSRYQMVDLRMDQVRCYTLTLSNGTKLILGRSESRALARLRRFLSAFPQTGLDINDISYIDLRYDVGFSVKKRGKSDDLQQQNRGS